MDIGVITYPQILEWVKNFFIWLWAQWQTQTLLYLIAGNFVVAVAVGISTGEFRLGKLVEVLYRKIIPWLMVYAFFAGVGNALELGWVATAAFGLITTSLLADLIDSLSKLGIIKERVQVPNQLKK